MEKKIGVVIVAAGMGSRMGGKYPKQFLKIRGELMAFKSLWAFTSCDDIDQVVLVVNEDYLDFCRDYLEKHREDCKGKKVEITCGGKERNHSVVNGLEAFDSDIFYVLIHDGARPFVSQDVIQGVIKETKKSGAAIACVSPKDTIRTKERTLNRKELYAVQTPQGFRKDILVKAYEDADINNFKGTDDASYVEQLGIKIALTEGSYENIKVTTREDMPVENRIGTGFDVHKFEKSGKGYVVLGGVKIPHEKGLKAHSDGDVLLHSVMDAILGAAALGDIGKLFPDTEPKYRDISSLKLLEEVKKKLDKEGFTVSNLDVTLIGQEPKIGPYREEIKTNISKVLKISEDRINVKGTTTEGLGFTGKKEGLACEAACILIR